MKCRLDPLERSRCMNAPPDFSRRSFLGRLPAVTAGMALPAAARAASVRARTPVRCTPARESPAPSCNAPAALMIASTPWSGPAQSAALKVERCNGEVRLRFARRTSLCGETEDAFIAFMLRFMRLLYDRPLAPLRIDLLRKCPAPGADPYTREFGIEPRFDADEGLVVFAVEPMDTALPGASPDLAQFNDRIAADCLAKLNRSDVVAGVRAAMVDRLSSGTCTRPRIARDLAMSEAALQQKLAERGTNFHGLLDETRCELAIGYLQQPALTITEIAFLLGFADSSNFTRAFKRWKGAPPSSFRA